MCWFFDIYKTHFLKIYDFRCVNFENFICLPFFLELFESHFLMNKTPFRFLLSQIILGLFEIYNEKHSHTTTALAPIVTKSLMNRDSGHEIVTDSGK